MRRALVSTIVVLGLAGGGARRRVVRAAATGASFSPAAATCSPSCPTGVPLAAGADRARRVWRRRRPRGRPTARRVAFRVGAAGTSRRAAGRGDERRRQRPHRPDERRSPQLPAQAGRLTAARSCTAAAFREPNLSRDIRIVGADGILAARPVIALPGYERYLSLSPDGTRLAFTTHPIPSRRRDRRRPGGRRRAGVDPATPFPLRALLVFGWPAAWRPSASRRAMIPTTTSGRCAADGTDQRQLTTKRRAR